jgi:hypothetical protein
MAERNRYKGDPATVAALLGPLIKVPGWIKYGEQMDQSAIESQHLLAMKHVLTALDSADMMHLTKATLSKALGQVWDQKSADGAFAELPEGKDSWVARSDMRLRTMLRHCNQKAGAKPAPPTWHRLIFGAKDAEKVKVTAPAAAEKTTKRKREEYMCCWDKELRQAYRLNVKTQAKEVATSYNTDGLAERDPIQCVFSDGLEMRCLEATKEMYDKIHHVTQGVASHLPAKSVRVDNGMFRGIHSVTKQRIKVEEKHDAGVLRFVLYQGKKQMSQLTPSGLSIEDGNPLSETTDPVEIAKLIMIQLAEDLRDNKLVDGGCKQWRDELVANASCRLGPAQPATLKKPAAAIAKLKAKIKPTKKKPEVEPAHVGGSTTEFSARPKRRPHTRQKKYTIAEALEMGRQLQRHGSASSDDPMTGPRDSVFDQAAKMDVLLQGES